MLNEWIKQWLCPCPQTFFSITLCLSYFISLCCTVLNITLMRNLLRSTDLFFERKLIIEIDCFSARGYELLQEWGQVGLRDDILRAWNSRKSKVVDPVRVLHRALELWGWVSGRWEKSVNRERRGFPVWAWIISGIYIEKAKNPFSFSSLGKKVGN